MDWATILKEDNKWGRELDKNYDSVERKLKAYLIEAKNYIKDFKDDSPEERQWPEQYEAATELVSIIEEILPRLNEISKRIPKINYHWEQFLES